MIRRLLERFGIIDQPEELHEARQAAIDIGKDARTEIHASREKRTVIQLDYELARRKAARHR